MNRFLALTGAALVLLGILHVPVYLSGELPWGALVSWRKPILFGLSTGITCASLAWVLAHAQRSGRWLGTALALAALVEVAAITLLTWLGDPTHVGGDAAALQAVVHGAAAALTLLIGAVTVRVLRPRFGQRLPADQRFGARAGLVFLWVSCLLGFWVLRHGQLQAALGQAPDVLGRAGVPKFAHGISLHALQVLPFAGWLLRRVGVTEGLRLRAVQSLAVGQLALLVYSLAQVLRGLGRFEPNALGLLLLSVAVAASAPTPWLWIRGLRGRGGAAECG